MSNTVTNTGWNPVQATTTYAQNAYSSATTAASNFANNFTADSIDIGSIGGTIGSGLGGGVAAFFQAGKVATAFKGGAAAATAARAASAAATGTKVSFLGRISNGVQGVLGGLKAALPNLAKGAGIGAAVSGVVSAGINGFRAMNGEITGRQFAGEVAADTVAGGLSSLGGLGLAAGVTALAGTMVAGLPLALLGIGAGLAGSMLTDKLIGATGLKDGIRNLIAGDSTAASGEVVNPPVTNPEPNPLPPPGPTPPGGDF